MSQPRRKAEPRFDIDVKWGEQGELQIGELLDWVATGHGRVEVKRKDFYDLDFYIETHCDKGARGQFAPSGISITAAHAWAFVIGESEIAVFAPTELLRMMLDHPTTRDKTCTRGNCPTRGKLINLAALLYEFKKRRQQPAAAPAAAASAPLNPLTAADIRWGIK